MAVLKDRTRLTGLLADTAAQSTALRAAVFFGQAAPETLLEPLEVALRQMAGRIFLGKVMNKQEVWTKPDLRFECLKLLILSHLKQPIFPPKIPAPRQSPSVPLPHRRPIWRHTACALCGR